MYIRSFYESDAESDPALATLLRAWWMGIHAVRVLDQALITNIKVDHTCLPD